MIRENRGGPQGGIPPPEQFPTYTLPLQEMNDNAGVAVKRLGIECTNQAVADDQVNICDNVTDFMVISDIYQYYEKLYKLSFGWEKTQLNIFASKDKEKDLESITFGGCKLKLSKTYTHLGLEVTDNMHITDIVNTDLRIRKAESSMWQTLGHQWSNIGPTLGQL